jgi:hypothetical protein
MNYEIIQIQDIKLNSSISKIMQNANITESEIYKPTTDLINKIKENDKEIYSLMKISFDKQLDITIDIDNNIINGFKGLIAYIILGYSEIVVTKETICDYDYHNDNYLEYEPNHYHFDSDGEPEESNDVWEYGDAYHLSDS